MKRAITSLHELLNDITPEEREDARISFLISNRIASLMEERNLSKKQLAEALGKRPSEITKWLSGQHNFTIRTIAILSTFFNQPIISVPK